MILSNIKKFCTLVTETFFKTLKTISSSGTGGLKFLKTSCDLKDGPIRVTEILSNVEIKVFKNLRPPVPEELILF